MIWQMSHRADDFSRDIADRHYNRQKVGSPQFAPPGRCLVLKADTDAGRAFWITSWPFARYVRHRWAGAWVCSAFRNEGAGIASHMIEDALAATRAYYGDPPLLGLVTFLDTRKVCPTIVRGREVWDWTWMKAGFKPVGKTKGGLLAFQLKGCDFPSAKTPIGFVQRHADFRPPGTWAEDMLRALVVVD